MKTFSRVWLSIGLLAIGFGITILIIAGILSDRRWEDIPAYSMEESYTDVEALDIQIDYGTVEIIEGDRFSIEADNLVKEDFESYVTEDGIWVIRENRDEADVVNLFGIRLSRNHIFRNGSLLTPDIVITIPYDFTAKDITIDIKAGYLNAKTIRAEKGAFSVEAGKMEVDKILITGRSKYEVGAGEMALRQMEAKDISVDCGLGNINIEGMVTGDNDIKCGVGRVYLELNGNQQNYSYDIEAGIGSVIIDGDTYHSMTDSSINNKGAANRFALECGIGNITVDFD